MSNTYFENARNGRSTNLPENFVPGRLYNNGRRWETHRSNNSDERVSHRDRRSTVYQRQHRKSEETSVPQEKDDEKQWKDEDTRFTLPVRASYAQRSISPKNESEMPPSRKKKGKKNIDDVIIDMGFSEDFDKTGYRKTMDLSKDALEPLSSENEEKGNRFNGDVTPVPYLILTLYLCLCVLLTCGIFSLYLGSYLEERANFANAGPHGFGSEPSPIERGREAGDLSNRELRDDYLERGLSVAYFTKGLNAKALVRSVLFAGKNGEETFGVALAERSFEKAKEMIISKDGRIAVKLFFEESSVTLEYDVKSYFGFNFSIHDVLHYDCCCETKEIDFCGSSNAASSEAEYDFSFVLVSRYFEGSRKRPILSVRIGKKSLEDEIFECDFNVIVKNETNTANPTSDKEEKDLGPLPFLKKRSEPEESARDGRTNTSRWTRTNVSGCWDAGVLGIVCQRSPVMLLVDFASEVALVLCAIVVEASTPIVDIVKPMLEIAIIGARSIIEIVRILHSAGVHAAAEVLNLVECLFYLDIERRKQCFSNLDFIIGAIFRADLIKYTNEYGRCTKHFIVNRGGEHSKNRTSSVYSRRFSNTQHS